MSMLHVLFSVLGGVAALADPVLTDHNVDSGSLGDGTTSHSGFAFSPDGILYEVGEGAPTRTQIVSGEWHPDEPDSSLGANFDVRCASLVSGTWDFQAAAVGTWVNMASEAVWRVTALGMASPSSDTCEAVFEIRAAGGGSVLATATLTATARS